MAAISALTRLLGAGEEVIAGDDLYGGTVRLLDQVLSRQGIGVRYIDATDVAAVREALNPRVRLILIETPSNPTMRIADIRALAGVAREAGALLAVDNSMLSPCNQKPLGLGADVVIHSATKFLCGHSDVTAGALVTDDYDLHRRLAFDQNAEGAGLSPFDSWLLLRGMKTLSLRVERQNESARKIAEFLSSRPEVVRVYYPGLADHPGGSSTAINPPATARSSASRPATWRYRGKWLKPHSFSTSRSASVRSARPSVCPAGCRTPASRSRCGTDSRRPPI